MISEPGNGVDVGLELFLVDMLELEVVPEHGLQGEAIEFLLGEKIHKIQITSQIIVHFSCFFDILPRQKFKID